MKTLSLLKVAALGTAFLSWPAFPADIATSAPPGGESTVIYRYLMPDGRIVYSDKPEKGGKIDHTIKVEPAIKGNLWTTQSGQPPSIAPQIERSRVNKVDLIPAAGRSVNPDEATSEVIRSEMLLEDARQRQVAGVEPLPGERTANVNGGSRLNEAYAARQTQLAKELAAAEAGLRRSLAERDALRSSASK